VGCVADHAGQFEQVLVNLVLNARDAMPNGGDVTIRTENSENDGEREVALAVEDTGIGMDEQTRARVFEPFFTTKERGRGTGLGLATVYGIVQQSGGRIEVASTPGKGTRFVIHLPRADGSPLPRRPSHAPQLPRGLAETVLLVEDERIVREVAKSILSKHGYRVLEAASADQALSLCETHGGSIALLLTDVVMPGLSGPALAQRIRARHPGMSLVYMSGYTADTALDLASCDSGAAFLQKPFTPATLLQIVRETVDRQRAAHVDQSAAAVPRP
jgi:CheY-like chemotaxis protein